MADQHGNGVDWPAELRRPASPEVRHFAEQNGAVAFHAWLQWPLERQLGDGGASDAVMQDLPIGVDPHGADAWTWQDLLAVDAPSGRRRTSSTPTARTGACRRSCRGGCARPGYQPFIDSIRATIAGAGGLRIDHVMGLFRLWWIPRGADAGRRRLRALPGRRPARHRRPGEHPRRAVVVGEDLGTVEDGVREALAEHGILSYRLLWFEEERPARWPASAMAAVSTHDLPTVAGLWSGADLADQTAGGGAADAEATERLRTKLAEDAALAPDASADEVVDGAYRALAQAPCTLLTATLEDALGVETRPNIPGTTERDNWCRALPTPIDELPASPGAARIAAILGAAVRS